MKNPLHMWNYWEEKYGFKYALEHYYPELLENNLILQALLNCKINEAFIRDEIKRLDLLEEDNDFP